MITVELARALLEAGVLWEPQAGDRFVIDAALLTGEVFWISDLTVEVQTYRDQSLLGFNGTTEWALDSVTLDQALVAAAGRTSCASCSATGSRPCGASAPAGR